MVVDLKLDSSHVPVIIGLAVIAECLLNPSYATQTVVQVRRPSCLNHKSVDLVVFSFGINDGRSLESWCIKGTLESTLNYTVGFTDMGSFNAQYPSDLGTFNMIWIIPKECTLSVQVLESVYNTTDQSVSRCPTSRFGGCDC